MAYNITSTILPSGISFYVKADSTNPTTIEESGSVTLKYYADGTYYILQKAVSSITVTGASIVSWTTATPFKEGTLIINNPTGNVSVTINAKAAISPLSFNKPFKMAMKAPVDTRLVLTKAQMKEILDAQQPDYYFAICKDDNKVYIYDKTLTANNISGKFRPIDNYLDFTSDEAKAKLNEAISNSVKIGEINQQITNIQGDINNLNSAVEAIDERVTSAENRLTSAETRLDTAESEITGVETDLTQIKADIVQAKSDILTIQSWINNVKLDGGEIKPEA